MAFRKLIAAAVSVLLAVGAAGCGTQPTEPLKTLVPEGAPALAMTLAVRDMEDISLDYASGTDLVSAELAKTDGAYDMIVAPVNLGLKAYEGSKTYQLAAVITWGNLYIVGKDAAVLEDENAEIALFGEGAIPGLVYNTVEKKHVSCQEAWLPSVAEAQQALLSGKAQAALLAEPAVTAALAKDDSLKVLVNLQEVWQKTEKTSEQGYPQAAVFVKKQVSADVLRQLQEGMDSINASDAALLKVIDQAGPENIGVPNAQMALKSWQGQNVRYVPGKNAQQDIETFLAKMNMDIPEGSIR